MVSFKPRQGASREPTIEPEAWEFSYNSTPLLRNKRQGHSIFFATASAVLTHGWSRTTRRKPYAIRQQIRHESRHTQRTQPGKHRAVSGARPCAVAPCTSSQQTMPESRTMPGARPCAIVGRARRRVAPRSDLGLLSTPHLARPPRTHLRTHAAPTYSHEPSSPCPLARL